MRNQLSSTLSILKTATLNSRSATSELNQIVSIFGVYPCLVKFLSYNNNLLYAASHQTINICHVEHDRAKEVDANDLKVRQLTPGLKICGLLLNEYAVSDGFQLVSLETPDNQLDFNRLF